MLPGSGPCPRFISSAHPQSCLLCRNAACNLQLHAFLPEDLKMYHICTMCIVQGGVCHSAVTMRLRSERCGNERDSSPTPGHIFRPCFGPSQWQRMGAGVMKLYFPNLNFHFYDTAGHRYNVF